jgi:hypothetical protein
MLMKRNMMNIIPLLVIIFSDYVLAHPSHELTIGLSMEHDGIWDAIRTDGGSFICCGYMGDRVWVGSLSTEMDIEWQIPVCVGGPKEEAIAICPYADGYAIAVNSGVFSPGARHELLEDSNGWILLLEKDGGVLDSLSCCGDSRRTLADITPGPWNTLACCGITYSHHPQGSGAFWLMDRQGSIITSTDLWADSLKSLDCIEPVPGGGYILGGISSVSPSFTVIRVDSTGQPQWITRVGPDLRGIHARDVLVTDEGSCVVVGGGFWSDPLAVELDMETGVLSRTILNDGWFTLFGCDGTDGKLLFIGHNMLCDGADSETLITGVNSDDLSLPLTITCDGACRCRTLISSGDTLFIFGEVSEYWDGHQDIWATATVSSDWLPSDTGSRLNADYE